MQRRILLCCGVSAWALSMQGAQASAGTPRRLQATMTDATIPLPPQPPAHSPGPNFQPAPMPNRDLQAPNGTSSGGTSFGPAIFTNRQQFGGEAFTPNSTVQGEQEKRLRPTPGFSLKVPLQ
jgi:hypothetical protein